MTDKTPTTRHEPFCSSVVAVGHSCDCGYSERVKTEDTKPQTTPTKDEELTRFLDLMSQFITQIDDDVAREGMEYALDRMRIINAE